MSAKTIGEYIKIAREQRNLTQEYVAAELGITQQAFRKIESNETKLDADRIFLLLKIFDSTFHEIFPNHHNHSDPLSVNQGNPISNHNFLTTAEKELYERLFQILQKSNEEKEEIIKLILKKYK